MFYSDEFPPDNQLRPDNNRQTQAIYWTIADFPAWYMVRRSGWFLFGTVKQKVVDRMDGGLGHLWRKVLKTFFGENTWNLAVTGVELVNSQVSQFTVKAAGVDTAVQDLKAFQYMLGVKGAGGTLPCFCCDNIVQEHGKEIKREGTNLKLYHEATYAECQLTTSQTLWAKAEKLERELPALGITKRATWHK